MVRTFMAIGVLGAIATAVGLSTTRAKKFVSMYAGRDPISGSTLTRIIVANVPWYHGLFSSSEPTSFTVQTWSWRPDDQLLSSEHITEKELAQFFSNAKRMTLYWDPASPFVTSLCTKYGLVQQLFEDRTEHPISYIELVKQDQLPK